METQWTDCRKGYRYKGFLFSEDGTKAKNFGDEYRETSFLAYLVAASGRLHSKVREDSVVALLFSDRFLVLSHLSIPV